ncbi:sideroflexin-1-like [Branchiostoma lanceolatum]|uniref:sideroflexin-1-like n=1 Tax=Branchiostoma lanceolatum TaxID=7740 RepID=UPI0034538A31
MADQIAVDSAVSSTTVPSTSTLKVNLDAPRFDQSTFSGRAKHFFTITDPRNLLATSSQLEEAKSLVLQYRLGKLPSSVTEDQLWQAKNLYDSAFHPDTGEKMFLIGRMSAQVPMNMTITGFMMTFYKTTPAVVFWQWINQSFNAIVNYTNRSGDSPIPVRTLGLSYVLATTAATGTALGLNSIVKNIASPLIGRYVPFAAVAAANCINIPCMRSRELTNGIPINDENGNRVGESRRAATLAITQVVVSRIVMAMPGMAIPPIIMNYMEQKGILLKRFPWTAAPLQIGIIGVSLVFATPLCCAIFPQKSSMSVKLLEPEVRDKLPDSTTRVYFNKGL